MSQSLGPKTEEGLKELFVANAEDYMRLLIISDYLERMGKTEEAKKFREKAMVEMGHAKAILATLIRYRGLKSLVQDMAKEESEQHLSEYNAVAMTAKAEGHSDVEAMLCSFAEQEKDIADVIKVGLKSLVQDMAKEESEQHLSEYNAVAMTAKAEGHSDVEAMLCSFAEQEKDIADVIKSTAKAL
jgi:rubrerythrin